MIALITKIYKTLTWRLTFLYIAATLTGVLGYTAYEMRDHILARVSENSTQNVGMTFTVSKRTEAQLQEAVTELPWILGAAVMSADLRMNEARTVFYVNRTNTNDAVSSVRKYPIFSNQEESNLAAIQLINGEFSCRPFTKSPIATIAPNDDVKTVCRISIPSYYGYFSGFITIFLTTEPDQNQQQQIRLVFSSLSTAIYFKDVLLTQRRMSGKTQ